MNVTFKMIDGDGESEELTFSKNIERDDSTELMEELLKAFVMFYGACTYATPLRIEVGFKQKQMWWDDENGLVPYRQQ